MIIIADIYRMNTIVTPDSIPVANLTPLAVVTAPVEIKLRMTPEEIREFVAKARAADEEKRRAKANAEGNIHMTQAQSQAHPGDSIRQ